MTPKNQFIFLIACFVMILGPAIGLGQEVSNVRAAFESLNPEPEVLQIRNDINVPLESGHLQGVQAVTKSDGKKLLLSGSSAHQSYFLQVDLSSLAADQFFLLMGEPYRHAGGFQVGGSYAAVGIEDNIIKTASKVGVYDYLNYDLNSAKSSLTIERKGEEKRYTSGATGMLSVGTYFLMIVSNWDSRNWDFYSVDPSKPYQELLSSFEAPDSWAGYQSINLLMDAENIYAIGTYQQGSEGVADLIHVYKRQTLELIMEKVSSKSFKCKKGVDFATAAGIEVDEEGRLHIWATQRDATKQIIVNKFSQR